VRVRLVAFATAAEALGASASELELASGASVGALRSALGARWPALAPRLGTLAIAVDGELAQNDRALVEGCEVALLPPVSGG
jgi:molybdopterin converting factor small subunit